MNGNPADGHPLAADVARLVADVASVATEAGDVAVAERIRAAATPAPADEAATVVVVGEKKRGKSSLINALVDRPDLLPVDVDVATTVHLAVGYAAGPTACVVDEQHPAGRTVDLADVGEYAALDPVTHTVRHPDVSHVAVGLPHPLLASGLCLIDTPGVGGLVAGHAAVTLAALDRADAVLFVVSGASELTSSECEFLARVTGRVATVLFALTQIDVFPEWRKILARNHDLISTHAPGLADAPWFSVSSRLRAEATRLTAQGHPDKAERWHTKSQFGPLEQALRDRVAGRAQAMRLANSVRAAARCAESLLDSEHQRLRSLHHDPHLPAQVDKERARLTALTDQGAAWRASLARRFKTLEQDLGLRLRRDLNDLSAAASRRITDTDPQMIDELVADLAAAVQALWMNLDLQLRQGVSAILTETASHLPVSTATTIRLAVPERLQALPDLVRSGEAGPSSAEHLLTSAGTGMLAFHLIGGLVAPVAGLGAGLGASLFLQHRRKLREQLARDRADASRHLQIILKELQTEFPPAIRATLTAIHRNAEQLVTDDLTARRREMKEALDRGERTAKAAEQELAAQRTASQTRIDRLTELTERANRLAARLGAPERGVTRDD